MALKKTMRKDKKKNIDKITAEIVKDPLANMQEIGERAGINKSSVSRNMEEVQQNATKDDRVISLTDTDFEIVKLTQAHTLERLQDDEEVKKTSLRDMTYIGDVSTKRYTVLRGNATDPDGTLKDPLTALIHGIQSGSTDS